MNAIGKVGVATARAGRDAWPEVPDNWYMLATSREVRSGRTLTRSIGTTEIVLARSPDGRDLSAFASRCAHMGCHLRHARVEAGGLRCALHQRLISSGGNFVGPNGQRSATLVQKSYPTAERYGMVFVWFGAGLPPDIPEPQLLAGETYAARPAGTFETATDWASLIANGFDMEHLATVHHRRLIEDATVTRPTADSFRLSYRSRVIGTRVIDRVIKRLSGNEVHATMTTWRGSMMFVESELGKRRSFSVLSMLPKPGGGTFERSAVGLRRPRASLTEGLQLRLTASLFRKFLSDDFQVLDGLRWHPPAHAHSASDRDSQALGDFFATLRQTGDMS